MRSAPCCTPSPVRVERDGVREREIERERARARASEGKRERYRPGRRARPPLLGRGGNLVTKVASQAPGLDHRIIGGGLLRR